MTKKILYIDLDNTLVDFSSGIARLTNAHTEKYRDAYDDAPGIFALMEPVDGAIEAYKILAKAFDTYILSTAPWNNPTAWQHKIEWVHLHLGIEPGTPAYKRLILSHHKNLMRGDFLVDDRRANGAGEFEGELIPFASESYETWPQATEYLLAHAEKETV